MKKRVKIGLILLALWLVLWIMTVVIANANALESIYDFAFIPFFIGAISLIAAVGILFSSFVIWLSRSGKKANKQEEQYIINNEMPYESPNNVSCNISYSGLSCPKCGAPIPSDVGAFCTNCGARLFNVGGAPSAFEVGTVASPKRMKNNAYANFKAVGFGTHWKATKAESTIIWISAILAAVSIISGIFMSASTGSSEPFIIGILIGIVLIFVAFAIGIINPAHRKEQKENMYKYGGKINYSANPLNGQLEDSSEMHIEKVNQNNNDE